VVLDCSLILCAPPPVFGYVPPFSDEMVSPESALNRMVTANDLQLIRA
jgi:hypothetical protein